MHSSNGPQTSLAFDLEGLDSHATTIDPAPTTASAQTADEQVEHYWAAMLRDVNFTDYAGNATVAQAVTELNNLTYIKSTANNEYPFPVTAQNLFRGRIVAGDGNVQGPVSLAVPVASHSFWRAASQHDVQSLFAEPELHDQRGGVHERGERFSAERLAGF